MVPICVTEQTLWFGRIENMLLFIPGKSLAYVIPMQEPLLGYFW